MHGRITRAPGDDRLIGRSFCAGSIALCEPRGRLLERRARLGLIKDGNADLLRIAKMVGVGRVNVPLPPMFWLPAQEENADRHRKVRLRGEFSQQGDRRLARLLGVVKNQKQPLRRNGQDGWLVETVEAGCPAVVLEHLCRLSGEPALAGAAWASEEAKARKALMLGAGPGENVAQLAIAPHQRRKARPPLGGVGTHPHLWVVASILGSAGMAAGLGGSSG
jgi:hypothetical protein